MRKVFLCLFILIGVLCSGQSKKVDSLLTANRYKQAKIEAQQLKTDTEKNLALAQIYTAQNVLDSAFYYAFRIDTVQLSPLYKAHYYSYLAKMHDKNNEYDVAYSYYNRAKRLFEAENDPLKANRINLDLYLISGSKEYLDTFFKLSKKNKDNESLSEAYKQYAVYDPIAEKKKEIFENLDKALYYNSLTDNYDQRGNIHQTKGLIYAEVLGQLDSALYHYDKADSLHKRSSPDSSYLFYSYINRASIAKKRGDTQQAILYLEKADSIPVFSYRLESKKFVYAQLSQNYQEIGDFKNGYHYLDLNSLYRDSLNLQQQNINLARFESEKKERENLILQQKNNANQRIMYASFAIVLALVIFGILFYKNVKKKQRITSQNQLIETQQLENRLKTQELNALDAMLAGQEKERQRLAGELHDNVGATLTALKIHFNHFKKNVENSPELDEHFQKTNTLLEDAYREVRTMAHIKNSGVIAKNGLLPAVRQLAKNASGVKNLSIEVQDFGLDERLENSLEVAIFRILQELITNIIKHANATEASISLTNHKDTLNIIVEDNGKGFDTAAISKQKGIGIANIEKRIEHLSGTVEIDSSKKGTSVIINIPL